MSESIYTNGGLHVASFTTAADRIAGVPIPESSRKCLQIETPNGPVQLDPSDVGVLVGSLIRWLDGTHYRGLFIDKTRTARR